jgi:uncharacterized phage-associated protein
MSGEEYKYNSVDFAKLMIVKANQNGISANMTKVQKLLYVAYGINLAVTKTRLLNEHPQAWPYGPVFPTTRNKLLKVEDFGTITIEEVPGQLANDNDSKILIDLVLDNYGNFTAFELTEWSHSPDSPWDLTVSQKGFKWGRVIEDDLIQSYFSKIVTVA